MKEEEKITGNKLAESFLTSLFQRLNKLDIQYCILHSYGQLPQYAASDIDIATDRHGLRAMDDILTELAEYSEFRIIQKLHYDVPSCYYYVVAYVDETGEPHFLGLDLLCDDHGIGRYMMSASVLLQDRRTYRSFYIPAPKIEATYLVLKRIAKDNLELHHKQSIEGLYRENRDDVTELLTKYLGKYRTRELEDNVCNGDWERFCQQIPAYQRCLQLRKARNLWRSLEMAFRQMVRVAGRLIHPTGLVIALTGPDGSGKTSIGDILCKQMVGGFRRTEHLHWRPGLLPPLGRLLHRRNGMEEDYTQPHRAEPHGGFTSLSRFLYYAIDFTLGYWLKTRTLKVESSLVIIDRYYYDYFVDVRRYRLRLPQSLLWGMMKVIPKPDMVVYLHNSPDALHARKQELTPEELARQVGKFQEILPRLPNVCKVDTDKPIEEVAREIASAILDFMELRMKERLR